MEILSLTTATTKITATGNLVYVTVTLNDGGAPPDVDRTLLVSTSDSRAVVSPGQFTISAFTSSNDVEITVSNEFVVGETFKLRVDNLGEYAEIEFEIVGADNPQITVSPANFASGDTVTVTVTIANTASGTGVYARLSQDRESAYKIPILTNLPTAVIIPTGSNNTSFTCLAATTSLRLRDTIRAVVNGIEATTEILING